MTRVEARLWAALFLLFCTTLWGGLHALGLRVEALVVLGMGLFFSLILWRLVEAWWRY